MTPTRVQKAPQLPGITLRLQERLRNGENQRLDAVLYSQRGRDAALPFAHFQPVRELNLATDVSSIALLDLERAVRTALWIAAASEKNALNVPHIAVGVKHGNACGAALAKTPEEALIGMIEGDPRALFGGSVVTNFPIGEKEGNLLRTHSGGVTKDRRVLAGLAAPAITSDGYDAISRKSRPLVAFESNDLNKLGLDLVKRSLKSEVYKQLPLLGLWIMQEPDGFILDLASPDIRVEGDVTRLTAAVRRDIALAWAVAWTGNSNTITFARGGRVLVNAVGGQDRVGSCLTGAGKLSVEAQHGPGLVAASDSFFPFVDGPSVLKRYGVQVILTTQGGEREREVAAYCRENDLMLVWIPDKLGRGFFGHSAF